MDQETIDYVNRISYPKLDIAEVEVEETLTYHLKSNDEFHSYYRSE